MTECLPDCDGAGISSHAGKPMRVLSPWRLVAGMVCLIGLWPAMAEDLLAQEVVAIKLFKPHADEVNWCPTSGRIAYAGRGPDNLYGIHTCSPSGDDDIWVTHDNPNVPPGHKGTPSWSPSGRYILFVAEKPRHPGGSFAATPGLGTYSDLWLMTADGKKAWPLTNLSMTQDDGIIIPRFSHDGRQIVWAQRSARPRLLNPKQICGFWDIKVADFLDDGPNPRLANIKTLRPGGVSAFNEAYGFTPDDRSIIFCSDFNQKSFWSSQIFTCDAATGQNIRQLTHDAYNEHATYSPDGRHIVWMTSQGEWKGTDWWMMNADGSGKRQLTFFNKPGHPEYAGGKRRTCGLVSFSPDGRQFVGGVQTSLLLQKGDSYLVTLR